MTAHTSPSVLVLGTSLAGLAAAYALNQLGTRVTIVDYPGWRDVPAGSVSEETAIISGCQRETWRLLHSLNQGTRAPRHPIVPLEFHLSNGRFAAYELIRLPRPGHWIMGLFRFGGLTWHERWRLFAHIEQIWEHVQAPPTELDSRTAEEWLASLEQGETTRRVIWNPLALWLTGNAISHLSAAVFAQELSKLFLKQASDVRLTCLEQSWRSCLILPLHRGLQDGGVTIEQHEQAPHLRMDPTAVTGAQLQDGVMPQADWYIAALPRQALLQLLPERVLTRFAYFARMTELRGRTQVSVRMVCRKTAIKPRLILMAEQPFHRLVISSTGPETVEYQLTGIDHPFVWEQSEDQILALGRKTLRGVLPHVEKDEVVSLETHRSPHAALGVPPGAAMLRPIQKSPLRNLLVAGDWTDTGWPANVESALVSARRCVDIIRGTDTRMAPH